MLAMGDLKVIALCSHAYCAGCIVKYIKTQNKATVRCPFCRKQITYLCVYNPSIVTEETDFITSFNLLFSEERTLVDHLIDMPARIKRSYTALKMQNPIKIYIFEMIAIFMVVCSIAYAFELTHFGFLLDINLDFFDYIENFSYICTVLLVLYSI